MPISPDSSYCLDTSVTLLEMTCDIPIGARLGMIDVDAIVDRNDIETNAGNGEQTTESYQSFANLVNKQVLDWYDTATSFPKQIMALTGLFCSADHLNELMLSVAGPLASEYLMQHGCEQEININGDLIPRQLLDLALPRLRMLKDERILEAALNNDPTISKYADQLSAQHKRFVEAMQSFNLVSFSRLMELVYNEQQNLRESASTQTSLVKLNSINHVKQARKAVRRGIKSLDKIVSPKAFKAFLSKDGFVITGHQFDYRVMKTYDIINHTMEPNTLHIPYKLSILNKAGKMLGEGCITFHNTPVLDQIIALTLHVRDKESELELIKITNWFNLAPEAQHYDVLVKPQRIPPLPSQETMEDALRLLSRPFYSKRGRIVKAIKQHTHSFIAKRAGIPLQLYDFMCCPSISFDELSNYEEVVERMNNRVLAYL